MTAAPLGPGTCDPASPGARNRYADLLRVLAIGTVVLGHWLLTSISYRGGQLSGASVMAAVGWSGWATLLFQVMPVFFLVSDCAPASAIWPGPKDPANVHAGAAGPRDRTCCPCQGTSVPGRRRPRRRACT